MDTKIYPCDACGNPSVAKVTCPKCNAAYCTTYCKNEDDAMHTKCCMTIGEEEIVKALNFFKINVENPSFLQDPSGRKFVPFSGKVEGETPRCMLEIYNKDGFGRKIWDTMELPCGMLDVWYYIVKREDLPKMIARIGEESAINLLILLSQSPLNKKP